jgi:hypothetical protein
MIKMTALTVLLLLTQTSFAEISPSGAEDLEEGTSYPYPFFYDDTDSPPNEGGNAFKLKADALKDESPDAWHGKIGNAKITIAAENTDSLSQRQTEREDRRKRDKPKKGKGSHFGEDKDDEKNDRPAGARLLIEWGKD